MTRCLRVLALALATTGFAQGAAAVTLTFTDSASFLLAVSGPAVTEDFESLSPGDPVGALGGITFSESVPGESLLVTDLYDQTSPGGSLSLGLDNLDEAFQDGDVLDLAFAQPVFALGLFVITSDPALAGEILLVTPQGTAQGSATPETTLGDGGLVYFVGLVSDVAFSSAQLAFDDDGEVNFVFNVDDVVTSAVVPEPGSLVLLAAGLCLLARRGRRI